MAFTALDVKKLREQTGCGMMDCKKALTESDGDFDKAVEYLREKGLAAAAKKAGRIAAEGMVYAAADVANKVGVVIEVNAETDFVAKNDSFQTFVKEVADVVMAQNPADVEALMACKLGEQTVEAALQEKILVIGENIRSVASRASRAFVPLMCTAAVRTACWSSSTPTMRRLRKLSSRRSAKTLPCRSPRPIPVICARPRCPRL